MRSESPPGSGRRVRTPAGSRVAAQPGVVTGHPHAATECGRRLVQHPSPPPRGLASIWGDMAERDVEVLVVDNASTDGSPEMVSREFPGAVLIRNHQNVGFAKANNQAIGKSSGRFVLLLNADARLVAGSCEMLIARMDATPGLGICGPAIFNEDGSRQPSWGRFPSPLLEFAFQFLLYKALPVPYPYGKRVHPLLLPAYSRYRLVDWVTAAAVLIRRDVVDKVGVLPEESFMYNEDVEFCFRARSAGFTVGYEPAGEVVHRVGGARASYEDWIVNYTRGSILYFASHFPPPTVARVARLMVAGNRLRYSLWRVFGAVSHSKRREVRDALPRLPTGDRSCPSLHHPTDRWALGQRDPMRARSCSARR